jgi:hypothetical protein
MEACQGNMSYIGSYENVNLPQPEAMDGNANTQRHEQERDGGERSIGQLIEGVRRSQCRHQAADEIIQDIQHKQSREAKEQPLRLLPLRGTEDPSFLHRFSVYLSRIISDLRLIIVTASVTAHGYWKEW